MPRLKHHDGPATAPENAHAIVNELIEGKKFINIFKGMVNSGPATEGYLAFSRALGKGSLGNKAREAVALYLAQKNSCDYCLTAHSNLARTFKFSDDDILHARRGEGHVVDDRITAVVRFTRALMTTAGGFVSDEELAAARAAGLTDGDLVELIGAIVLNLFTNYLNHLHHTDIDLPNPQKVTPV